MDPLIRADPTSGTLTVDAGKMLVRCVITTDTPDRGGDVVIPTGLKNAEEFLLNPVVLWAHNRSGTPPIGTCAWLDVQPHRIVAETRFAQGVPFAEDVFRLYEQGVLRGWSIGFVPRKAHRIPKPNGIGLRVDEWDLLEYSAVPIPENPRRPDAGHPEGAGEGPHPPRVAGRRAGRPRRAVLADVADRRDDRVAVLTVRRAVRWMPIFRPEAWQPFLAVRRTASRDSRLLAVLQTAPIPIPLTQGVASLALG